MKFIVGAEYFCDEGEDIGLVLTMESFCENSEQAILIGPGEHRHILSFRQLEKYFRFRKRKEI
jgi:hypothetical protein